MKKLSIVLFVMSIILIISLASCDFGTPPPSDPCAEGHTWGDYTVITEASCYETGKQSRECSVCGETEEAELPLEDHSYGSELKFDANGHWEECSVCADKTNESTHSFGDWVVVTEPTYTDTGLKKQSCVCGYYVEATIDTLVAVSGIELNKTSATLILNGSTEDTVLTLVATVLPENAENKNYRWESTNSDVAAVYDGTVYAMGLGTCEIRAISEQGEYVASCQITVINVPESVSLSGGGSVALNGTLNLTATVLPADAADKSVVWQSSNENVLKVEDGVVTAVGAGKATITVTTSNGKSASVEISVIEANIDGNLNDSIYDGINPYYWELNEYKNPNGKTHNVAQQVKIYFGEDGLYIAIDVDDAHVKEYANARLETFLMLGDTPTTTNAYQIRFYMNSSQYTYRFYSFGGDTSKWNWNEKTTTSSIIYSKSVNDAGYIVEAFVPYADLGLSEKPENVNYMSVLAHMPEGAGSGEYMNYGTYDNLYVVYASLQEYKVGNYIQYNANGVVYKTITVEGDFNLDATNLVDGKYESTFTIDYLYGFNPATGAEFTGTGAEFISEVGNGVYKISIPNANIGDFAEAKTIKASVAGLEKELNVTIVPEVLPSSVVISGGTDAILKVGETVNLIATVAPSNAFNTNVIWTSSNPSVATVVNGVVTALKEGAATITATSERDATVYDSYTVAVLVPNVEMNFDNSNNRLENTGSDSSITASANKLNSEKNSTSFIGYDYAIVAGANGTGNAIGINHSTGAFPVMNKALGAGDFTISFNFNINGQNTSGGSGKYLFGTVQPDGTDGFSFVLRNNTIRFRNDNETKFVTVTLPADDKAWHNITLTRNGTALTLYYDGASVATFTIAADKSYGAVAFGAYYGQGNWGYLNQTFYLDDVMFFDRALTSEEILAVAKRYE